MTNYFFDQYYKNDLSANMIRKSLLKHIESCEIDVYASEEGSHVILPSQQRKTNP